MLGGFLGAGKTTAIARLARHYLAQGRKVGLVTNDQAFGLVDTLSLRAQGFQVGEVTGACFCCKFHDLVATAQRLAEAQQPDVILAEPVGSCTDLVATVIEPLRQLYGQAFEVGPLAVLLKPEHGEKILSGRADAGFSPKAAYIFLKQLEEADVVVVNKADKLSQDQRRQLVEQVRQRFPDKQVLAISARDGAGFESLIAAVDRPGPQRCRTPEMDYDVYAEGEAELGWLNCQVRLRSDTLLDPHRHFRLDDVVLELVRRMEAACAAQGGEPAHLKVLGQCDGASAIANLVAAGAGAELSLASAATTSSAELTVNARVAIAPETLAAILMQCVTELAAPRMLAHEVAQLQHFRPGRPVPTHRMPLGHGA